MDLTFLIADKIKSQVFNKLFNKVLECEEGKKYLNEQCSDLGKCYVPYP